MAILANDYDCVACEQDFERVYSILKGSPFAAYVTKIGEYRPIIQIYFPEEEIQIEINVTEKTLSEYLARLDYKLSTLCVLLNGGEYLPLFAPKGCIKSARSNHIAIHNLETIQQEFVCLLRLVKLTLKYPERSLDDRLASFMRKTNLQDFFQDYVIEPENSSRNQGAINTALNQLYARFPVAEVNQKMLAFGLLPAMTGLPQEALSRLCEAHVGSEQLGLNGKQIKQRLYMLFLRSFLKTSTEPLTEWPFYMVMQRVSPALKDVFEHLDAVLRGTRLPKYSIAALLRIINLSLTEPDSELTERLSQFLEEADLRAIYLQAIENPDCKRSNVVDISRALSQLLLDDPTADAINTPHYLDMLSMMTGFSNEIVLKLSQLHKATLMEDSLPQQVKAQFYRILVCYFLDNDQDTPLREWPFYPVVACMPPEERRFYQHLDSLMRGTEYQTMYFPSPEVDMLRQAIRDKLSTETAELEEVTPTHMTPSKGHA